MQIKIKVKQVVYKNYKRIAKQKKRYNQERTSVLNDGTILILVGASEETWNSCSTARSQGMGQHIKAAAEALMLMQCGEKCKRSEVQKSNNYNTQQRIRAQLAALAKLTVACGNPEWKQ